MSAFDFRRVPLMPEGAPWRALDQALARWTLAHGGSARLAVLAGWLSWADGAGDTALALAGDAAERYGLVAPDAAALDALACEPLVGDGRTRTPFVLDPAGRLYLARNFEDERVVAAHLRARRQAGTPQPLDEATLDLLFHGERSAAVERQRMAVRELCGRRLFVLTGGPGTGKTTTVLRMLLALQADGSAPLIQLAAPTGKAAQRLLQALRAGKRALQEDPAQSLPTDWQARLEALPDTDAPTLHRLLGFDPRRNTFARHAGHPLPADVLVVDEASMVDLALLRAALDALRPDATLVLVGDADQLTSVGAGSVLMDVVGTLERERAPELVRLERSFRAARPLVAINRAVREGAADALRGALAVAAGQASWRPVADAATLHGALADWADALAVLPLRPAVAADEAAVLAALRVLGSRQLLCALREGPFGALAAHVAIEQALKRAWGVPAEAVWYPGRAVLVTRNDYAARLYNGDVGLCLGDAQGRLAVWFESADAEGRNTVRSVSPGALPPHEGAFALTIHKAQGSEYDDVAVLLPPDPANRILSRQLLYTGLSRARRTVALWADEAALQAALARPVRRAGGLADRLADGRTGESTAEAPQQLSLL